MAQVLQQLQSLANSRPDHWNVPASQPQLVTINSLLSEYSENREERLLMLSSWFGRTMTSSKELTKAEASAIIDLAFFKDWTVKDSFISFIKESKDAIYQF